MGIMGLDNERTFDHKKFILEAKNLMNEIKELRTEFQQTMEKQATYSKQLVDETHTAYESGIAVL